MQHAARVLAFLRERREEAVALAERLVAVESPSRDSTTHAAAFAIIESELVDMGFAWRYVIDSAGRRHLLARPAGRQRGRPLQLLLGHIDTVWPVGTLEKMPLHRDGGRLAGPGTYDMKVGLVQALYALRALYLVTDAPGVTPVIFINSDEEIGSYGSRRYIEALARRADRAFVMEPSLGVEGKLKTARKGVGRYSLRIRGKAAHAGLDPGSGASAILELSHQIQRLFALNDPASGITVNVGVVDGGMQPNVIAPESSAQIDVRVPTHEVAERVHAAIKGLRPTVPGVSVEVHGRIGRPPMEPDEKSRRLWEKACAAAESLGIPLEQGAAGGGSDGNFTSQFTPTLDGLGAVGDGAHAHHEHVLVDRIGERAALLALLLLLPPLGRLDAG
jgi:glutamate carboxypeptidase